MTPTQTPAATLRLRRSLAGVLAAGAVLTGTAGVIGAGIALSAGPAAAGPAEDCAAVRARDHQIYLNLIASLPPGAPVPPEYINPCLTAPTTTPTVAPTTIVGLPGAQAPGGGPNVGANAPTNFPTYNGTPIVPVPGGALPGTPGTPPTSGVENPAGVPVPSTTGGPAPTTPQPAGSTAPASTTDRGPGPIPAATPNNAPAQSESTPTVTTSGLEEADGRDRYLELVLVGAAAFTAGGIGVRGRRSPYGPRIPLSGRTPESVLSQAVGTLALPLMAYTKGGQSKITVTEPGGGRRTFFLIHDETSSHEAEIPVDVPPGGHMSVNPDGTVTVFDADGNPVSVVAAPWAYDANGNPVPTDYEVRDGHLIQKVYADEATAYPILADPPEDKIGMVDTTGRSDGETWTETLPGGQTATHTLINAEAVDTRITREDGTWTDTRTNDDGQGNVNTWSDDSWGAASYNNTDVTSDESSTETWTTDSPTNGASPDAVSEANAANTEGSTVVANQDGTTSTANWAANDDGSYDSAIVNPDQSNSYVHSGALDEDGNNYTTALNNEGTQSVLTPDGDLIALNPDRSPTALFDENSEMNTAWNPLTEKWEPVPNPSSAQANPGNRAASPGIEWAPDRAAIEAGTASGVIGAMTDATGRALTSAATASADDLALTIGRRLGPAGAVVGMVPGISNDIRSGMDPSVAVTSNAIGAGAGFAAGWLAAGATGAAIGTLVPVPGVGTAAGFVVGVVAGGVTAYLATKGLQSWWK